MSITLKRIVTQQISEKWLLTMGNLLGIEPSYPSSQLSLSKQCPTGSCCPLLRWYNWMWSSNVRIKTEKNDILRYVNIVSVYESSTSIHCINGWNPCRCDVITSWPAPLLILDDLIHSFNGLTTFMGKSSPEASPIFPWRSGVVPVIFPLHQLIDLIHSFGELGESPKVKRMKYQKQSQ